MHLPDFRGLRLLSHTAAHGWRRGRAGLLTGAAVLLLGTALRAQSPGSLDLSFAASTDKTVIALAMQADGRAVVSGNFTQVNGVTHGNVVRLNVDGSLDPGFNVSTDANAYGENVSALALQPDGKIVLSGHFTQVNGTPHAGVARLLSDGSLDPAFNATVAASYSNPAYLNAVAVQPDGKIIVAGSFDHINGATRNLILYNNIARLNPDGSQDMAFNAGVDVGSVTNVAVLPDGKIVLAGPFSRVNGVARNNIARLNPDGSLDAAFQANIGGGFLFTLAALPDGRVVLGGEFSQVNGVARNGLARLNADGTLDAGFNAPVSGRVLALAVTPADGRTVLGGSFLAVSGAGRTNVARLNADGTLDTSFFASADGGGREVVLALGLTADGKLLLGGRFTQVDGVAHPNLARLLNGAGTPVSPPVVSGAIIVNAVVGQPFSYAITASNAPSEYGAGGLPPGLSVDHVTGIISGTPTAAGTFTVTLYAVNGAGAGTGSVVIGVLSTPPVPVPVLTGAASAAGQVGQPFSYQIVATGNPTTYSTLGLPGGLGINLANGLISGTPTISGSYAVTLVAANATGTGTAPLTLTIAAAPPVLSAPVITSAANASGQVGQPFTYQIMASGNPAGYAATGLPDGLSVNPATGLISGAPTSSGSFAVTVSATNVAGRGVALMALTIAPPPTPAAPVLTSVLSVGGQMGQPFVYRITATGNPTAFSATGLPVGLNIDNGSGVISGVPASAGVFSIPLSAVNAGGVGTATLTLTIERPKVQPPFFRDAVDVGNGFSYLSPFGYYKLLPDNPGYLYHNDLGFLYLIDANDGRGGIYFYDFATTAGGQSLGFVYTSPSLFPYLYSFGLNTFVFYFPDVKRGVGFYTSNPRVFSRLDTGEVLFR